MNVQVTNCAPAKTGRDRDLLVEVKVISMTTATERRRCMTAMLEAHDFQWSFFDAHTRVGCDGPDYDANRIKQLFGRALAPQEAAVYSSHYALWKKFLEEGTGEYLLVLEDDLILDPLFPIGAFAEFCRGLDLDYIRLFGKHFAPATRLGFFYDRSIIRHATSPTGAQAYVLSRKGAGKLLTACRSMETVIDIAIDRYWATGLPLYSLFPYPVIERFVPTQIPIPVAAKSKSRSERWKLTIHRASEKYRKIRENRRLARSDVRLRSAMPLFHQIVD